MIELINVHFLPYINFMFHANNAPGHMNEIFSHRECDGIPTGCSYRKLKLPHHVINQSLRSLSYIETSLWNNLNKSLKTSASVNAFKHNLKDFYFRKGNKLIYKVIYVHGNYIILFLFYLFIYLFIYFVYF